MSSWVICRNKILGQLDSTWKILLTYRRNGLIVEREPLGAVKVLDVRVVMATAGTARVDHDRKQLVHVRTGRVEVADGGRATVQLHVDALVVVLKGKKNR